MSQLSVIGGARVGGVNATWPLARLSVSDGRLRLNVALIGAYDFAPQDVIEFRRYGLIPVLSSGVAVVHRRADYPQQIVFWSVSPEKLIARIHAAGFVPCGEGEPVGPVQVPRGFPVKPQALIAAVVVWNLLLAPFVIPSMLHPGSPLPIGGMALAVGVAFAAVLATKLLPPVQRAVLKEGRSLGEISPILNLLAVILGFMTAGFCFIALAAPK